MKSRIQLLTVTVGLLFILINDLEAQSFKVKNYTMSVSGTSTMHDWQSSVESVSATGSFVVTSNDLSAVKDVMVKIPVTSIKSTKGKTMDKKTFEAFNYEKHPQIIFVLTGQSVNESTATVDLKGSLTMAGKTRPIDFKVTYKVLSNGELKITGSKRLTMSEFGMEPPTAMMGAIKVGDDIDVSFDMTLTNNISAL
jgi:hypothetical protein